MNENIKNPLRRIRSDSVWNGLAPDRRRLLDQWLFVERLSYKEVRLRAEKEWGVKGSITAVGRYYRRTLALRGMEDAVGWRNVAEEVQHANSDAASFRSASLRLLGQRFLQQAMENGDVKELVVLGRLMDEAERRNQNWESLRLERERFEFNAAKAALAIADAKDASKAA